MPLPPSPAEALPGDWLAAQARRAWGGCEPRSSVLEEGELVDFCRAPWGLPPATSGREQGACGRQTPGLEARDVDLFSILLSAKTTEFASGAPGVGRR